MKLKFLLSALTFVAVLQTTTAQNVGINSSGTAPNVDAMLDIVSTTKGLLIPRMTSTQRIAIAATPATGLLVYDITLNNFYYFDGASWVLLATGANSDWKLTGNASTSPSTNFLGTTDPQDLVFKTNNTEKMRILSGGNVGIGTSAPGQLLEVNGGNILAWKYAGNPNIIQRRSNGSVGAEANLVANDVIGYNNFQAYQSSGSWPNVVRVGAEADGAHTSTSLPSRLIFSTTPSGSATLVERMRISNAGNVGINNNAPAQPLDVTGNVQFSGALMPNNLPGTTGQLLTSAGTNNPDVWVGPGTANQVLVSNGAAAPSYSTLGSVTQVIYRGYTNLTETTVGGFTTNGTAGNFLSFTYAAVTTATTTLNGTTAAIGDKYSFMMPKCIVTKLRMVITATGNNSPTQQFYIVNVTTGVAVAFGSPLPANLPVGEYILTGTATFNSGDLMQLRCLGTTTGTGAIAITRIDMMYRPLPE